MFDIAGKIIMWVVSFGCAILFFSIGVYAQKLKKPMWFWSGSQVDASELTDVEQYNKENGIMWKLYSLWYILAGLTEIWNPIASVVILVSGATLGVIPLVFIYKKIYDKYRVR